MFTQPWPRARESCHGLDWTDFRRRFDLHFPGLCRLFHDLYGSRADWLEQLTALLL
jgi:amylosucrase